MMKHECNFQALMKRTGGNEQSKMNKKREKKKRGEMKSNQNNKGKVGHPLLFPSNRCVVYV